MKRQLIAATGMQLFAAFTMANAAPVYLECSHVEAETKELTNYKITLNEEARTVTYLIAENGNSFTTPAQFLQATVLFSDSVDKELGIVIRWQIDRTTLKFTRTIEVAGTSRVAIGTCKVAKPIQRQF